MRGDTALITDANIIGPTVLVGQKGELVFTLKNAGDVNLLISGPPRVALSGVDAKEFSITQDPATPVLPGENLLYCHRCADNSGREKSNGNNYYERPYRARILAQPHNALG